MDIYEPRTPKLADMRSRGPYKHCCKVCTKNFPSGKALGGHMSCHRHGGMQPRCTRSPPANVVNAPVSLLGLCDDEKPSLPSLETQCFNCSKEFSTFQSLRENMRMHNEEKVIAMSDEEPAGLMESSANVNGDHGHNVVLFSPVKRKRSKRGLPGLNSEMCAASALLMLAESDKSSGYKDCHGGYDNDNISTPNLLKEVNLNAFDRLVHSDEFTNNTSPESYKCSAYEGLYELSQKENSLNFAVDVPRKMALINVFDHGPVNGDSEFMKPEADISVEEMKSGKLSVAVNIKRYKCQVCGKLFESEHALGFHMRLHCEKENSLNLVAGAPKELLLNVFDHGLDIDAEFMKSGADNSVEDLKSGDLSAAVHIKSYQCKVCGKLLRSGRALGGHMTSHLHRGKENTLNLVADAPKTEVLLNVFDHGLDVDVEFMKPGADISVEELKFSNLSGAINVKRYECNVCGKLLMSGRALGGHMTSHSHREQNTINLVANVPKTEVLLNVSDHELDVDAEKPGADISIEEVKFSDLSGAVNIKKHQGVAADCPNSGTMEEQMQKLGLNSPFFYRRRPRSRGSEI